MTSFTSLPGELLQTIAEFCTTKDSKSMSLTSKCMHDNFKQRIWRHPLFKYPITLEQLAKFAHLPIRELHSRLLKVRWWRCWSKILEYFPLLNVFHIDEDGRGLSTEDLRDLFSQSDVYVVIHTRALVISDVMNLDKLYSALSSVRMKGLAIDHCDNDEGWDIYNTTLAWSLHQLRQFLGYPLIKVSTRSLLINKEDVPTLIKYLSANKHCVFSMDQYGPNEFDEKGYLFTLDDFKKLADSEIVVPTLATSLLEYETDNLSKFIPVLGKLRGLKDVHIDLLENTSSELLSSTIALFAELPVRLLSTDNFLLESGTVEEVVEVMSKMKYLESVHINGYHWACHKLSLEEFKLFRNLPVKTLSLRALDEEELDNYLLEFRDVMMEMKIPKVKNEERNVIIYNRGEGDCFQTV